MLLSAALSAETAILDCTADGWVERGRLTGTSPLVELDYAGKTVLMAFRASLIAGWKVTKATLILRVASETTPQRLRVGVVGRVWKETDETASVPSAGTELAVPAPEQGWLRFEVDPRVVQAIADGKSHGLLLSRATPAGDYRFHAREGVQFAPILVVDGQAPPVRF